MDFSKLKPNNKSGARDRFYDKTGIAKYREWRGLKDTFYDYTQWLVNLGIMAGFVVKSPVRIMRGFWEYRWMGSYLASLHWIDKCMEGLEGPALRVAHSYMHTIMQGATGHIAATMMGDRRFGDNPVAGKQVLIEQAMAPEIVSGFKDVQPMSMESFQGLLGCYMDQQLPCHYLDTIEHYGLPADSCRLSATAAGVAINDDFPLNGACVLVNNMPCDSSTMNTQLIDRRLTIPTMVTSVPMRWEDERTNPLAVSRMRKAIAFIAKNTGSEYSVEQMRSVLEKHNEEIDLDMQRLEYGATPYTPYGTSLVDLFHVFYYSFSGGRMPAISKTEQKCLKIAEECYSKKLNCFPKARHRIITWGGPGCYFFHLPQWLYNCWGILTVAQMSNFEGNVMIDTSTEDSMLLGIAKSYEHSVMRRHLTGGYKHLLEFWQEAQRMNADMVLMFDDITCKGAMGMAGMVNDQCRQHPEIHLLWVQNDMFDHRTISRNAMRQQINDYMFSVMQEEPLDASLLDFDDSEGW